MSCSCSDCAIPICAHLHATHRRRTCLYRGAALGHSPLAHPPCVHSHVPQQHAEFDESLPGTRLTSLVASTIATLSHLAMHVHLLCALVFLCDLSLATAPFPLGSLLYALVRDPRPLYWRALLVYTETLLLLEYVFQVTLQVGCLHLGTGSRELARQLGLHESLVRHPSPHACTEPMYVRQTAVARGVPAFRAVPCGVLRAVTTDFLDNQ